jgi:hypothetical protein
MTEIIHELATISDAWETGGIANGMPPSRIEPTGRE